MRVSYRWLAELLPDLTASADDVARRLTAGGLEVEAVHPFGAGTEQVVVAEILQIEPHPERDKLRLVTVGLGSRQQRVVCGAANVPAPGGRVALAPEGSYLPAVNLTLTPKKIGGV
jgi:phenylalanyl-tRNA synthetase beta chain